MTKEKFYAADSRRRATAKTTVTIWSERRPEIFWCQSHKINLASSLTLLEIKLEYSSQLDFSC